MLTCEILITTKTAKRGIRMLHALRDSAKACGVSVKMTESYQGECDWLMMYGPGGSDRYPAFQSHIASGRHAVVWDMGYWNRGKMLRVSIDALHPQEWIWRKKYPRSRLGELPLRNTHNPSGPIIFASMGKKSQAIYGEWDRETLARLHARSSNIIVREKPDRIKNTNLVPIEKLIDGASLIVTHHSNVAIDGIIAGIPFECEDGAAAAYRGDRMEFLNQLAWFQWSHTEAPDVWQFLLELI